jgi:hypothetical protein
VLHQYCAKVHRVKQHCWQVMRGVICRRDGCTSSAQRLPCLDQALLQCGSPGELTRRNDFSRTCFKDVNTGLRCLSAIALEFVTSQVMVRQAPRPKTRRRYSCSRQIDTTWYEFTTAPVVPVSLDRQDIYLDSERHFSLNIYTLPGRVRIMVPDSEGGSRRQGRQSCSHI